MISLFTGDPFLANFIPAMSSARTAIAADSAADLQAAMTNLGTGLAGLASAVTDEPLHAFSVGLAPSVAVVQPAAAEVFALVMTNYGRTATTYDLSVSGLPPGTTYRFSASSVTLQPGESIGAGDNATSLTHSESGDTLVGSGFTVTATAEVAPRSPSTRRASSCFVRRRSS